MQEQKFENYFGRKIAVDASMHIYQFMVVVRWGAVGWRRLHTTCRAARCLRVD
jgi:hypothetical protein